MAGKISYKHEACLDTISESSAWTALSLQLTSLQKIITPCIFSQSSRLLPNAHSSYQVTTQLLEAFTTLVCPVLFINRFSILAGTEYQEIFILHALTSNKYNLLLLLEDK